MERVPGLRRITSYLLLHLATNGLKHNFYLAGAKRPAVFSEDKVRYIYNYNLKLCIVKFCDMTSILAKF